MNAADIKNMFQSSGQEMTIKKTTGGTFDPVTGTLSGETITSYTVNGITKNYTTLTMAAAMNSPDSLIQAGDKQALVDAVTVTPDPGDTILIQGEEWEIIAVNPLNPAGADLMYILQIRK